MKKYCLALMSTVLGLTPAMTGTAVLAQSTPSGSWLGKNTNWNRPNARIPKAPVQSGSNLPNCQKTLRPATSPEDQLVKAAGWSLTNAAQVYGKTTVITGTANADGMCRPLSYQVFVFNQGKFVGTLSPVLMDSRTDGSLYQVNLYSEDRLNALFNRYTANDPLCCASGESRVFYQMDSKAKTPMLIPQLPADTTPRPPQK
jgi:hypothetical protein